VQVTELWRIFKDLYGPNGLVVNSNVAAPERRDALEPSSTAAFESEFSQFGTALTSQIVSLPLPRPPRGSPISSIQACGCGSRARRRASARSCRNAPRPSARACLDRVRRTAACPFDSIEGVDLNNVPAVFTHDDAALLGGREDVVTTVNRDPGESEQVRGVISYGVTNTLDVSIALPGRHRRSRRHLRLPRFDASAPRNPETPIFPVDEKTPSARGAASPRSATRPDPVI
jgi:hypothetical protein